MILLSGTVTSMKRLGPLSFHLFMPCKSQLRMFEPFRFRRRTGCAAPLSRSCWEKTEFVTNRKPSESTAMLLYSVGTKDSICRFCASVERIFQM